MALRCFEVLTAEDRERVFRLRYEIYVGEMARKQEFADHGARRIEEPLDDPSACLFAVEDGDELIGTVRTNFARSGNLEHPELYGLEDFGSYYPDRVSMATKLMVRRDQRGGQATHLLIAEHYRKIREQDVAFDILDCNPHLVPLYQKLGCRLYRENIQHPDYGTVIPMVLVTSDLDYFEQIASPVAAMARQYPVDREAVAFFRTRFPEYAVMRPISAMAPEDVWSLLAARVGDEPTSALPVTRGLSPEETLRVIRHGATVDYRPGDRVFDFGETSNALFIVLSGSVDVSMPTEDGMTSLARLDAGEVFGEMGFVTSARRSASIVVNEPTRLLVVVRSAFERLERDEPLLANRLLKNLFEIVSERVVRQNRLRADR